MIITATELKMNLGKYLDAAASEDVYILKNGKMIAKLSEAANDKQAVLDGLVGIANGGMTLEQAKLERLARQ